MENDEYFKVLYLPLIIPEKSCEENFLKLLSFIKPSWSLDNIFIKYFNLGTTNTIISASLKDTPVVLPLSQFNQALAITNDKELPTNEPNHIYTEVVLIRVYGNGTNAIIDRRQEIQNMVALKYIGLGSQIYCAFNNGLCYEHATGYPVTTSMVRDAPVYHLIAHGLAKLHSSFPNYKALPKVKFVDQSGIICNEPMLESGFGGTWKADLEGCVPCFFPTLKIWANLIEPYWKMKKGNVAEGMDYRKILRSEFLVDIWEEIDYMEKLLLPLHSPVIFCHNDLLIDNIIYDPDKKRITLIDVEFGDFNFQAFEIAQFFCEFVGIDTVDYTLFPDRPFRLKWLRIYYAEWVRLLRDGGKVVGSSPGGGKFSFNIPEPGDEEGEVEKLCSQVDKFIIAPHLYWGVYSILQSCVTTKSFDHWAYAKIRLGEYARLKADPSILMK